MVAPLDARRSPVLVLGRRGVVAAGEAALEPRGRVASAPPPLPRPSCPVPTLSACTSRSTPHCSRALGHGRGRWRCRVLRGTSATGALGIRGRCGGQPDDRRKRPCRPGADLVDISLLWSPLPRHRWSSCSSWWRCSVADGRPVGADDRPLVARPATSLRRPRPWAASYRQQGARRLGQRARRWLASRRLAIRDAPRRHSAPRPSTVVGGARDQRHRGRPAAGPARCRRSPRATARRERRRRWPPPR